MFEIPGSDITEVQITAEAVQGHGPLIYVRKESTNNVTEEESENNAQEAFASGK